MSLVEVFRWIGSITSVIYFCSPLYQIILIFQTRKDEEQFYANIYRIPLFLLITILFNCLFWVMYSTTNGIKVLELVTNAIGLGVSLVILFVYLYFYLEQNIKQLVFFGLFVINLMGEAYYLMMRYIVKEYQDDHPDIVEIFANSISICMYLSPLQNIFQLIKFKHFALFPIVTLIFAFFNTLFWLFYGAALKRPHALITNGIGFLVVLLQIGFWFYYFAHSTLKRRYEFWQSDDDWFDEDVLNDILEDENEEEQTRKEKEKEEREKKEREKKLQKEKEEAERIQKEKEEAERIQKEKEERRELEEVERILRKREEERREREEAERIQREKEEEEERRREREEAERIQREKEEAERREREEAERIQKEKEEAERREIEEVKRIQREREENERRQREEYERREREIEEAERREREKEETEKEETDKREKEEGEGMN